LWRGEQIPLIPLKKDVPTSMHIHTTTINSVVAQNPVQDWGDGEQTEKGPVQADQGRGAVWQLQAPRERNVRILGFMYCKPI
jgi:hypothetical protein